METFAAPGARWLFAKSRTKQAKSDLFSLSLMGLPGEFNVNYIFVIHNIDDRQRTHT